MNIERVQWDLLKAPERSAPRAVFPTHTDNANKDNCEECGRSSPCQTCFKVFAANQNILVKQGLVDPQLYKECMPSLPSSCKSKSKGNNSLWQASQCITGIDFMFDVLDSLFFVNLLLT